MSSRGDTERGEELCLSGRCPFCESAVQSRPGTGTNEIGESMAKKELLEDAIKRIARRAGIRKGRFT